jgi:hypothetical protein
MKVKPIRVLLGTTDCLLALFLFTPLTVANWRGIWNILDLYLFPANLATSAWVSAGVGTGGCLTFYLLQDILKDAFHRPGTFQRVVLFNTYSLVFGMFSIGQFRGVWLLWDHYTGTGLISAVKSCLVGFMAAVSLRSAQNFCAQPFVGSVDTVKNYFECPTRFKTKVTLFLQFSIL